MKSEKNPHVLYPGDWCRPWGSLREHIIGTLLEQRFPLKLTTAGHPDGNVIYVEGLLSECRLPSRLPTSGNARVVSVKDGLVTGRTDDLAVARALSAHEFSARLMRSIVKHGDLSATVTKECVSVWTEGLAEACPVNVPADVVEAVVKHLID